MKKQFNIYLDDDLKARLREQAMKEDRSINSLIRTIIIQYLNKVLDNNKAL